MSFPRECTPRTTTNPRIDDFAARATTLPIQMLSAPLLTLASAVCLMAAMLMACFKRSKRDERKPTIRSEPECPIDACAPGPKNADLFPEDTQTTQTITKNTKNSRKSYSIGVRTCKTAKSNTLNPANTQQTATNTPMNTQSGLKQSDKTNESKKKSQDESLSSTEKEIIEYNMYVREVFPEPSEHTQDDDNKQGDTAESTGNSQL